MPKGYWVSAYRTVSDPAELAAYDELARPAVKAGGGRILSRGSRVWRMTPESPRAPS
jgi:uncharacterized protein (DUF1330 family)